MTRTAVDDDSTPSEVILLRKILTTPGMQARFAELIAGQPYKSIDVTGAYRVIEDYYSAPRGGENEINQRACIEAYPALKRIHALIPEAIGWTLNLQPIEVFVQNCKDAYTELLGVQKPGLGH